MAEDMLYKPNLTYSKNYYTEGNLYDNSSNFDDSSNSITNKPVNKIDRLEELRNEILNKLPMMPEDIVDAFLPPFYIINGIVQDLQNNKDNLPTLPDKEESEVIVIPGSDDDNDSDDESNNDSDDESNLSKVPDNPFDIEKEDGFINIKIEEVPKDIELEVEYISDLTDIIKDYLEKYNAVYDTYINGALSFYSLSNHKDIKNIETKDLTKNTNLSHISDFVTKSNISVKQKVRLANKMFDLDETIFHIRATKVANELRKRYYSNEKLEDKNILTKGANDLLKESRIISQKKYEENFYALYKYLNSSVIIFNECIGAVVKQKRALITLNNEERE